MKMLLLCTLHTIYDILGISRTETIMMRKKTTYLICTLALGCTGTDYIADPPMPMEVDLQPTLVVTPDMAAVEVGSSQALEAVYLDEMGMTVADVSITWMVSDQNIATIDTAGVVAGLSAGQVSVTAQVGEHGERTGGDRSGLRSRRGSHRPHHAVYGGTHPG